MSSFALTSGPSQPEMQSFEPVGTTDLVDIFSGDFNYNIPLMDVEGYPINISYHSGVTIEQEASWVGLGWNINPGCINHIIRGISDDYKGDEIKKTLEIKPEVNNKVGLFLGAELAGANMEKVTEVAKKALDKLKGTGSQIDFAINFNNYNGVSASLGQKNNLQVANIMPGVNLGLNTNNSVNTADGADFDYGASMSFAVKKENMNLGFSINGGMNSRDGLKYTSFGVNPTIYANHKPVSMQNASIDATFIPIGLQNYVAVNTNASTMKSEFFQLKVGGEVYAIFPFGGGNYYRSTVEYDTKGDRNGYGYFYLDQAGQEDILDFSRDKDGKFNKASTHLPMASMTYDIYSVSGQGTGGNFRPFRDGLGTVYDPLTGTDKFELSNIGELGFGNVFEAGFDTKIVMTNSKSGAWKQHYKKFKAKEINKLYEPFYFKQAGELTESNPDFSNNNVLNYAQLKDQLNQNNISNDNRNKRANLLYFLTASDASLKQVSLTPRIENYNFDGFKNNSSVDKAFVERVGDFRKAHHASEYTQILPDGRRYIYGLPAYNIKQKDFEVSVATDPTVVNNTVSVSSVGGKPDVASSGYIQSYYSEKETPSSVHSYLLTSIVSPDYSDLTGDGISDDDLGTYTKFNYRKREDYQWKTPYANNTAQYNKGLASDCNDNKGNISIGVREQWYVHSIESKNYVAEFFTTARIDAKSSNDPLIPLGQNTPSYKLDSIVLYNKYDRFTNHTNAEPIKTVIFGYNYGLCKQAPNSQSGKLTLTSIYIRNGRSSIGLMSPYQFAYGNQLNPNYNFQAKDCWGNYKPIDANNNPSKNLNLNLDNTEFPYLNQNDPQNDEYANAWNLTKIQLPSGGIINIDYESDDYGYVQDKKAMEMYRADGVGPTKEFVANNSLYNDIEDPYTYIYFKRKNQNLELKPTISESYLDGNNLLQYTFNVEISPGQKASCPNTPLKESIKGYAKVIESGACSDGIHGYIKIEPKDPNSLLGLGDLGKNVKVNPITMAAIYFARYYNMKALKPEGDIPSLTPEKAVIKQLVSTIGENINFFQNPIKTYLKKQKAKFFDIDKSYIRLVSQGLKKKGGGNRVKRLEYTDNWSGQGNLASNSYGSDYRYTIFDESLGKEISSGVASYEPLFGGDENPNRTLQNYQNSGNNSKFPPVDAIELLNELPLGETMYPTASVGYSKVTVTSIHKDEGASSQTMQEHEFYTAKDFPVIVKFNNESVLSPIEKKKKKVYELFHKKERLRVSETYSLFLNDMHGKAKKQSTWVSKDASLFGKERELVSYTKYDYFTENNQLNNNVPCLEFAANNSEPHKINKILGVETDFTLDSREMEQQSKFINIHFSTNTFLAPPIPVCIPLPFPSYKKESTIFSSFTGTKINQQYGILKAVETFDKGGKVRVENESFDPLTGQVLVTKVNSEYNDLVYNIKYPAYWAYRCMGAAYENILYEENIENTPVEDGIGYIEVDDFDKFNIGDEVIFTNKKGTCPNNNVGMNTKFKLWVVGKEELLNKENICETPCATTNIEPVMFSHKLLDQLNNPIPTNIPDPCVTLASLKATLFNLTQDQNINSLIDCIKKVEIETYDFHHKSGLKMVAINSLTCTAPPPFGPGLPPSYPMNVLFAEDYKKERYSAESMSPYPNQPPYPNPNDINISSYNLLTYHIKLDGSVTFVPLHPINSSVTHQVMTDQLWKTIKIWVPNNNTIPLNGSAICAPVTNQNAGVFYDPSIHPTIFNGCYYSLTKNYQKKYDKPLCQSIPINQSYKKYLLVKPINRNAKDIVSGNISWPIEEIFRQASIKVIRSGKRNQLSDNIQEVSTLEIPYTNNNYLKTSFNKALATSSRSYTEFASIPEDLADPNNAGYIYYNPFVIGQRGNYRVQQELLANKLRDYNAIADKDKGTYAVQLFWSFGSPANIEFYKRMLQGSGNGWYPKNYVNVYSAWGNDLQIEDAVHNKHSNIFGYGNSLPIAVVSNSEYNTSMVDNFEDYKDYYNNPLNSSIVQYFQNAIKLHIKNQFIASNLAGTHFNIIAQSHTGKRGLQILNTSTIPIKIISYPNPVQEHVLYPFNFAQNNKYVVSLWQYIPNGTPPLNAAISISVPGYSNTTLKRKTPVIDGWAQYEAILTIPVGNMTLANVNFSGGASSITIDDLRILPVESNMKSYVYDYNNRKLVAVLDENNMATFFEYNHEGKLIRLKKETEKGIITLKESRESLRHVLGNPPQNQAFQDLLNLPVQ